MKKSAKLRLSRETVRLLNPQDLTQAHGQGPTFTCSLLCETISCLTCGLRCQISESKVC